MLCRHCHPAQYGGKEMYLVFLRCVEGQDNYGLKADCKDWPQKTVEQLKLRQMHYTEDLKNPVSISSCRSVVEQLLQDQEVMGSYPAMCETYSLPQALHYVTLIVPS